ncbi:lipid-A-disaccharide synthase [Thiohalospira halophila DSM 15071]|uniref:Lipid-A-disaccharide synthase n=1 Tax=Thiohalospira halophila DSM 15071 TaxID=1123397 RepID=A0A1I1PLK9_9GAMM|nr:lipid-A-disaccharide synthase [Thiohalospira halophila]SFD06880.1 lipid-A-disaccharide synthase [Thiohalospira halophila DSM 15071]
MSQQEPTIMVVAGETSGDAHTAEVVRAIQERRPGASFFGVGGERLRAAGVDLQVHADELSVMGIVEVLRHYPRLRGILKRLQGLLAERRPDLLIVTDLPDFNLRLAATAQALGIPVLYYVSPQVWAWRSKRVKVIRERVDAMAVLFPFEVPIYEAAGVPVRFVGHPLVRDTPTDRDPVAARHALGLPESGPVVGLLPGSRRSEIAQLMPPLADAAARLRQSHPDVAFVVPVAPSMDREAITGPLAEAGVEATLVDSSAFHDVIAASDAVASASGTATLEVALMETPLVVTYKVAPLTYAILRRLVKLDHVSLVNIVAERGVVKEFIQGEATGANLAGELERLLDDGEYAEGIRRDLAGLRARLGEGDAASGVADWALELVDAG